MKISKIIGREILDSRGNPTVEVDLITQKGLFRSAVPSGASTGIYEALEMRDGDKARYNGKGVLNAVKNLNEPIARLLENREVANLAEVDALLLHADGTENKSKFGANAILAVSMAACKAFAAEENLPLYAYLAKTFDVHKYVLPLPSFNVINGGKHAGNKLAMQEFMILPAGAPNFREAMRYGAEIYHTLSKILKEKYGLNATNVGDEGGFAPDVQSANEALDILTEAISKAGYKGKVKIGMDVAASEFFEDGKYNLNFKDTDKSKADYKTGDEMVEMYKEFVNNYDIISIEDPFDQDDWDSYAKLTAAIGEKVQIVGDDLLVTNPKRIAQAIDKSACNALLLKVNQIGTVSEAVQACIDSKHADWGVMVSHRSGETEDSFIADLVVGIMAGQIKTGAPCRSERLAKYNQLMRIEEELGLNCQFAGNNFRHIK